jgi:hypothetical protein
MKLLNKRSTFPMLLQVNTAQAGQVSDLLHKVLSLISGWDFSHYDYYLRFFFYIYTGYVICDLQEISSELNKSNKCRGRC